MWRQISMVCFLLQLKVLSTNFTWGTLRSKKKSSSRFTSSMLRNLTDLSREDKQ